MKTKLFYSIMMIFGLAISGFAQGNSGGNGNGNGNGNSGGNQEVVNPGNCDCTDYITSPTGNFPNGANKKVCFVGEFEYASNIQLKNGVEICVGEGVTLTGNISNQNWGAERIIRNYGDIQSSFNDNMANFVLYNYGEFDSQINFNQGDNKSIYNYGVFTTSSSFLGSGTFYNYSEAELNFTSTSNVALNGISFELLSGEVNVSGNLTNNSELTLENAVINIEGNFTNNGSGVTTSSNNECSQLNYNSINNNHGLIESPYGNVSISSYASQYDYNNLGDNVSTNECGEEDETVDYEDCNCDIVIDSATTVFPNVSNKTICFIGEFNYDLDVQLGPNVELCVGDKVNLTGSISKNGNSQVIRNYGVIGYGSLNNNNIGDFSVYNFPGAELNLDGDIALNSDSFELISGVINVSGNYTNGSGLVLENAVFNIEGSFTTWGAGVTTSSNNECSQLNYNSINDWHGFIESPYGSLSISSYANNGGNIGENVSTEACEVPLPGNEDAITWLGNNQNWTNNNNWSGGVVPAENDAIVIPTGLSNYPRLPNNSNVEVGSIDLKENAFIDLNGKALIVNGGITGGGMIKSSRESSLTLNGDSELFFDQENNPSQGQGQSQPYEIGNLIINSGTINLNNELSLFDVLSVNGGVLNSNDNLTLECRFENPNPNKDNYTTAQVGELSGEINGLVTVEQCYSERRAFRYLTSSVNTATSIRENWQENPESYDEDPNPGYGTHITGVGSVGSAANLDGLNGFDWQPSGNPSMFEFDHSNQSWYATDNTNETNLEVGQPYRLMIRGDRSIDVTSNNTPPQQTILRATGTLHKGDYSITIDAEDIEEGDHVFFANPYQTNVNLNPVFAASEGIQPFFYIWDPTLAERGAYSVIDLNENSYAPEDSNISQFMMPQQAGFFVVSEEGAQNGVTINFNETQKEVDPTQNEVLSQDDSGVGSISLLMYDQEQELAEGEELKSRDGIVIQFDENGINEIDDEDAYKSDNLDENLARMHGSKLLTIERRAMPQDGENLQLFTNKYRGENYVFKINVDNLPTYTVYLKDNYTNELIELSQGENIVEFNIDSSINASVAFNRFEIQFEEVPMSVSEVEDASVSLYPNPVTGSTVNLQLSSDLRDEEFSVAIYNTLGNRVYTKSKVQTSSSKIELNDLSFSAGVYFVKVSTSAGKQFTTKLIKK